jgi:hypothetical protein
MGQYHGDRVAYVASSASVGADLVVLTQPGMSIRVTNISGAAPLWFTVSAPGGACPIPTSGGTYNFSVAPAANAFTNVRHDGMFGSVVQVVSSGTTSYMVEVQGQHATS